MKVSENLPALVIETLPQIDVDLLKSPEDDGHKPRILLLYGSLRSSSYSRFAAEEAARILQHLGCETKLFDPRGLPQPDDAEPDHPKVAELRDLAVWSEGMVWSSPEQHGAMTGIMKSQIDWLPLSLQGGHSPDPRENAGHHAGFRGIAVVQCGQSNAHPWPLDADGDDPKSVKYPRGLA